jgi:hydroxyquinol 1,2-dioxygenase
VPNAPQYESGGNISLDGKGEPLVVRGRVTDTWGNPIAGAKIDVWQTNDDGFYDVQQKGVQPDMNLRGLFNSNVDGEYWFRSSKPRYYPIPDDGPVGKLLHRIGRHPNRAAHLHMIVTAPGAGRHAHFHAGLPLSRRRRCVRGQGKPHRRFQACR